jgi:hypothetical protein
MVFGCVCFVHLHDPTWGKLYHRALKCIFVGYFPTQKEYKSYHPHRGNIFVSMNVSFPSPNHISHPPKLQFKGECK